MNTVDDYLKRCTGAETRRAASKLFGPMIGKRPETVEQAAWRGLFPASWLWAIRDAGERHGWPEPPAALFRGASDGSAAA